MTSANDTTRRRRQETMGLKMIQLHEQGLISDQVLLMYGISGDLPERDAYNTMSSEEKERLWHERIKSRLGPNWMERFSGRNLPLPIFPKRRFETRPLISWKHDGF